MSAEEGARSMAAAAADAADADDSAIVELTERIASLGTSISESKSAKRPKENESTTTTMSLSSSFHLLSFQRKVQDALQCVERTLELERKPRLAADVDHTYGAKYGLVNLTSNAAIIAYMNCLERLGLDANALKLIDKTKPTTLRFDASTTWKFLKEVVMDLPVERSWEEKEETKGGILSKKTRVMKAVNRVTEYHWQVKSIWSISVYSGTALEDKKVVKCRSCATTLITQSKGCVPGSSNLPPTELSLTWLLKQIDFELASKFKVDIEAEETKTPRRNDAVQHAEEFASHLRQWCDRIQNSFFDGHLKSIVQTHNPAIPKPQAHTLHQLLGAKDQYSLFNPILPLMEDKDNASNEYHDRYCVENKKHTIGLHSSCIDDDENKLLLSQTDMSKLLNLHIQCLDVAICGLNANWSSDESECLLSSSEATLSLLISHLIDLSCQYIASMTYIESTLETQLVDAIGKRLAPNDLDKFVKYHNARLLSPMPRPFSHAIRCPGHNPVGLLTIESDDGETECIHTHSREVLKSSLRVPLSAATVLDLTGKQYLHGYMNHRFGTTSKRHQLVARARQFSAFIMIVGNMTDSSTLDPKDAVIVLNKDEVIVSLLLDELPTAKEFKDAVKSLSPEQQRFARAYRKMQLSSSIFGVCIVQIKPQLEALLGLPKDALDKEMKLTQDLMELFVEYQVPSDMLSYSGFQENVASQDKVSNVKDNVKSVLGVVNAEKEKQLKLEQAKTEMAMEEMMQGFVGGPVASVFGAAPTPALIGSGPRPGSRSITSPMQLRSTHSLQKSRYRLGSPDIMCGSPAIMCSALASVEAQSVRPSQEGQARSSSSNAPRRQSILLPADRGGDFTLIPQILDEAVERYAQSSALRSTTIKTGNWSRSRQENLLTGPKRIQLSSDDAEREKNKAFDLLDALSRSGSFPITYSDLHVIVAVTHCFDKDVMSTVVCDNVNPIEKLECSTLILASAVHGVPARELIGDVNEVQRLVGLLPSLLKPAENNDVNTDEIASLEG